MQPDLQRRVQRYGWDKAVNFYEQSWRQQLEPGQSFMLEKANIQPGERVLDVACGTGLVSFQAAEKAGGTGEVVGTDLSDKMVETAARIASDKNISNVIFKQMDAEALSLPGSYFDVALDAFGTMYYPDPVRSFHEKLRVLKSGGRVSVAVWGKRDRCGWAEIFPIVDARVKSEVCPMFFQLGTGDTLAHSLKEAGFRDIQTKRISTKLHYDNEDEALGAAFQGGPVALAYSRFREQTRREVHKEYLGSIETFRNDIGYAIPGEFVVAWGVR